MAYTQADLDRIEAEIAKAESEIQFGDRRVKKRSIAELLQQRDLIKGSLESSSSARVSCTLATLKKE